ncbi:hypothetical protein AOQ84DRAFT_224642 [Glonium stellatum]|uniref:Glycosyl hydrolase family 95 N-terminal domain-containing protein n=1 Tax=Glonium stellatum TaxID=574774 RepID=A0A8E2JYD3_9PEZI|nr:hypothetical protein AOQ84DRAFT_224642 [Glonium stellatum]
MVDPLRLWYKEPASKWPNALPIGNRKLGAMLYGEVQNERWQLNEDSVWYGCAMDRNPKDALKYLPRLRQPLEDGLLKEAEDLVGKAFMGMPEAQRHYEPLGQVNLNFLYFKVETSNYKRYLDSYQALSGVSYEVNRVQHVREIFASHPDNIIGAKISSSPKANVSFDLRLFRGYNTSVYMDLIEVTNDSVMMKGQTGGNGVRFCAAVSVNAKGGQLCYFICLSDRFTSS